jgi:hypothetical protein
VTSVKKGLHIMTGSFLLTSPNSAQIAVDQFHVNVWFFSEETIIVDLGLLIRVPKTLLSSLGDLILYIPFNMRTGTTSSLHEILQNDHILQLVFNDEVRSKRHISHNPNQGFFVKDSTSFKITPRVDGLRNDELNAISTTDQSIGVYSRIRFEVDIKNTSNIYFEKGVTNRQILYDFRFNERRLFDASNQDVYLNTVNIYSILIFVIQPNIYRIVLSASSKMRYIRLLEKEVNGWDLYIPNLKNNIKTFLVYSWKGEQIARPDRAFNLLVSFEIESGIQQRLIVILVTAIFSYLLITLPQNINFSYILSDITPYVVTLFNFLGIIGGIAVTGMLGNILWDLIKYLYNRFRSQ